MSNFLQLLGIVIVFIIILVITYFTTKWIGSSGYAGGRCQNIKAVETYRIGQNKFIQILKAGDKYFLVGVSKDRIDLLAELNAEDLKFDENTKKEAVSFKDILSRVNEKHKKRE